MATEHNHTRKHELVWTSEWLSIRIGVAFTPFRYSGFDHLQIRAIDLENAQLPVSETGSRSYLVVGGEVEAFGDALASAQSLIDEAATKAEWQDYLLSTRQGFLF